MKYRKSARPLALAIASLLALQPVSAFAVTFADINQVPWPGAEVSINKAADLGLVVGETKNGKNYFRPKDTVSLSESCQFAYKVMLQTKKATANSSVTEKWKAVLNTYNIQEWAHPAVAFCLEKSIISIPDLSSFVKNGVNMPASREQAGEILGRTLTVGIPSYTANAAATKFGDNSSIASDARPYIALLNDKGIIKGDDLGNFNPKKTLNRTETAVMITNLYEKLKAAAATPATPAATSQKASGKVATITANYVNLENSNSYYRFAPSYSVTLNGSSSTVDALVTLFKNEAVLTADITMTGDYLITKLVVTSESAAVADKLTEGEVTKVTFNEKKETGTVTIEKTTTYNIEKTGRIDIEIDDKDYEFEKFYDLYQYCKEDDKYIEVRLTLDEDGDIKKIKGDTKDKKEDSDEEKSGEVKKVTEEDDNEASIKVGSKNYDIEDVDDVDIDISNGANSDIKKWEDLYEAYEMKLAMEVTLTLNKDGDVTKIKGSVVEAEGTLYRYKDDYIEIDAEFDGDKTSMKYKFDDGDMEDIKTDIKGVDADDLEEFYEWLDEEDPDGKDLELKLKLDSKGKITEISGEYDD